MPVICIGPVCIPLAAVWPLLIIFIRPLYNLLLKTPLGKYLPKPAPPPPPEEEPAGSPITVVKTEEQWEELTKAPGVLVAQFTATWCGPCKRVSPLFSGLARSHPAATYAKVDIDAASEVADECGVSSVPQFHVFRDGKCIDKLVGARPQKIMELVRKHCGPEVAQDAAAATAPATAKSDKAD